MVSVHQIVIRAMDCRGRLVSDHDLHQKIEDLPRLIDQIVKSNSNVVRVSVDIALSRRESDKTTADSEIKFDTIDTR